MINGIRLLKISAIYLMAGGFLGLFMGISHDFILSPVHVHVSLLGWLTLAVAGLVYALIPACAASPLARVHFWGLNIGPPVMMASLSLYAYGIKQAEKLIAVSSVVVVFSILMFVINVCTNAHKHLDAMGSSEKGHRLLAEEIA